MRRDFNDHQPAASESRERLIRWHRDAIPALVEHLFHGTSLVVLAANLGDPDKERPGLSRDTFKRLAESVGIDLPSRRQRNRA